MLRPRTSSRDSIRRVTGYQPQSDDTHPAQDRLVFERLAQLDPAAKFALFLDLQSSMLAIAEAGIRLRHPAADEREVRLRRAAMMLDASTMRRVFAWDPETAPA